MYGKMIVVISVLHTSRNPENMKGTVNFARFLSRFHAAKIPQSNLAEMKMQF
jgi:hypothetical protein